MKNEQSLTFSFDDLISELVKEKINHQNAEPSKKFEISERIKKLEYQLSELTKENNKRFNQLENRVNGLEQKINKEDLGDRSESKTKSKVKYKNQSQYKFEYTNQRRKYKEDNKKISLYIRGADYDFDSYQNEMTDIRNDIYNSLLEINSFSDERDSCETEVYKYDECDDTYESGDTYESLVHERYEKEIYRNNFNKLDLLSNKHSGIKEVVSDATNEIRSGFFKFFKTLIMIGFSFIAIVLFFYFTPALLMCILVALSSLIYMLKASM